MLAALRASKLSHFSSYCIGWLAACLVKSQPPTPRPPGAIPPFPRIITFPKERNQV